MALNKVDICGLDTSSLPRLTQQQSRELLLKIKRGDVEAREEFIRANLRLVLSVIQRFSGRGEQMDDLFQVGCIGLIKAVENFNTDLEVRFSTYAVPMIIGELRRYLRDNTTLRVSRSLRDTAYKALRVRNDLMDRFSREPRLDEIARELEMSEEDVAFALEAIQDPVSLFEPIYHDDGDAIFVMDQVRDDKDCDDCWLDGIAIGSGLDRLQERERKIIELRFFQGRTQMEVAEEIGISQAQVSRLEKSALKHMRKFV
ncbi:MAG TPA: RNA polymerase sporulation sigma factor SigG [Clostridia bacterium]|nr:RNA polymerase sporulation sigma factor SigG [Clostridia bacterium]